MRKFKKGIAVLASTVLMVTSAVNYHGLTFSTNVYSEETSNAETVSEVEEGASAQASTEASAVEAQAEAIPANVEVPEQSAAQEVTVQEITAQDAIQDASQETVQETVVVETIASESSIESTETGIAEAETKEAETESAAATTMVESENESDTEVTGLDEISEVSSEVVFATELSEDETEAEVETETEIETEAEEEISEKETETEDGIEAMSLLPLEEVTAYLDLKGKTREELYSMTIDEVLDSLQDSDGNKVSIPENATTAWRKIHSWYNELEDYVEYSLRQNVEFDPYGYSKLELIVGSKNQLDKNNKRYLITIVGMTYDPFDVARDDKISYELYAQDGSGVRTQIVSESVVKENDDFRDELNGFTFAAAFFTKISVADPDYWNGKEYYLGLCSTAVDSDMNIDVYTYDEYLKKIGKEAAMACTDQILNQDMTQKDSGMKGTYEDNPNNNASRLFCIEYSDPKGTYSSAVGLVEFSVVSDTFQIENSSLYKYNGVSAVDATRSKSTSYRENCLYVNWATKKAEYFDHIEEESFVLREGYSVSDVYYKINAKGSTSGVIKAVKGLYKSLEQAADQPDIKEQLISETGKIAKGCKVDGSNDGSVGVPANYFTVFEKNGSVLNVCVYVYGYEYTGAYWNDNVNGKIDPWFQICGVKQNNNEIAAFIVQNGNGFDTNLYTMYGYGYQTVLIQDENVDLSQLQPIWTVDSGCVTKVTVNGQEVKSGQVIDCSNGNVQYTIIVNGHQKNYQVNFVKATSKAKLFVAGPQTQEVILNSTSGMHDIFIANLGQEELTGLRVELNATNCKLDDYWTVGGENNDTLAPFDSVTTNAQSGILGNVAKIRLIESDTRGTIQGTLTVYADGQEPIVINLIGYSQNPEIVTNQEEFSKVVAIKYVPYSYMITTDNMYDWLDVSYELASGYLPNGVELYSETGEIYGVPEETGTFEICVKAKFISKKTFCELSSSTVNLVLTVEENTAETVFKASSEGYGIKQALGTDMGDYNFVLTSFEDAVFVSYGEFSEYCGVWLNGNKLEEGKDYDAESGSTRITIHGETFENTDYVNQDGENTIAIEFRKDGKRDEELKRTSQNFTIDLAKPTEQETTKETTTEEPTKPTVAPTTEEPTKPTVVPTTAEATTVEETTKEEVTTAKHSEETSTRETTAGTKADETKSTVSSTETPETAATAKENETSASSTETTAASVKCTVKMVDAENKAIDNLNLELHSTPQAAVTDANGCAAFESIEFGSHTLSVKAADGTTEGFISFTIAEGNQLSVSGNVITAPSGSDFILIVRYDQNSLEAVSVHDNSARSSEVILGIEDYAEWIGAFLFGVGIAMAMYLCVYAISSTAKRRR